MLRKLRLFRNLETCRLKWVPRCVLLGSLLLGSCGTLEIPGDSDSEQGQTTDGDGSGEGASGAGEDSLPTLITTEPANLAINIATY